MYKIVSTDTFKVVEEGEDSGVLSAKYDMRKHVILSGNMPDVKPKNKTAVPIIVHDVDYDFSKLSKSKKQTLLSHYHNNELDKVRDLINRNKVAHICCQGQYEHMINQIKKAKEANVL